MTLDPTATVTSVRSDRSQRFAAHFRVPLHRNGYALVMSTFSTAGLGALYWAIAARRYSSHDVGINASLVSTMMFLTNLASLNFTDVLNRFVPVGGRSTRRLVLISYGITVGLGGISATIFVLGLRWWSPWLTETLHGSLLGLVYVLAVMLWVVFVLQDAVLIGLRRTASYVLVENTGFGIAKVVLLFAFAAAVPTTGIFLSWTAPLVIVVLVVNVLVFRNLLPAHEERSEAFAEPITCADVSRFLIADYIASLLWTATIALMPVVVLNTDGASASAYVYLAWTVAYTLYLVSRNMGMALTTEGAQDPGRLAEHTRATLKAAARIVVPLALVLAAGAPLFLKMFGNEYYTAHATGLLRLFALAMIPIIVPTTFVTVARVQRRLVAMVVVTALTTVPVLVLSPVFMHFMGISGVGLAWLVVESAVAIVLLAGELRPHWRELPAVTP